tara:strand:- start:1759 stop:3273 length:1515 start_codon:yes stop_codon:yes gene_type:complete
MSPKFTSALSSLRNHVFLAVVPALLLPLPVGAKVPMEEAPAIVAVDKIERQRLEALSSFIDRMVADQLKNSEVAGAVVTVVYDGQTISNKGYGFKNIEAKTPVDPNATLFHPGSVSKLFTWVALMQQIEAGTVDLDADVNSYIDFEIPRNGFAPIKVRDLFSHRPGMSDISDFIVYDAEQLMPYSEWMKARVPRRVWAPGVETAYSNFGAMLAGYIVERVSGEPFDEYTANHIFKPLGMTATTFSEPLTGAMEENMATGYKVEDGQFVAKGPEYLGLVMPAGSSVSTGRDMARFMLAMLNGGTLDGTRILKPESVRLLVSDSAANAPRLEGMAHGFLVEREASPRLVGHAGNTVDFHSDLVIAPELGFGYYISMSGGEGSSDARTVLTKAITGYMFPQKPTARWSGATETAPMGRYRSNRRDYGKVPNTDYDIMVTAKGPDSLEILVEGEKAIWERIGPHLYEKVTGVPDGGPYERVEFYQTDRGARLSFSFEPYTAYHFIGPE